MIWGETVTNQPVDPANLNEMVKTTKKEELDTFSSKIIHGQMKTLLLGNNIHVMTQSLKGGDGSLLASWLECGEHAHQSEYWEQVSHGGSEKPDSHVNHYCQGY